MPRLPFLLLIEEKEAKEDQGDDRLQVGRMGAGGVFWPSWGASGWVRGVVLAFAGCVWMGVGIDVWFHGMLVMVRRDWYGWAQKKPDTGSRRCSAGIRLGGWGIEVSYGFR